MMTLTRIHLISSPRNLSTALMYSFAQREDTAVVDEPLYGHYLNVTEADHPGKADILAAMETDWHKVVDQMINCSYDKPVVFFKDMAHHMVHMEWDFLFNLTNLFLIRNPKQLIQSFAKVIPHPRMEDVGVEQQYHLFEMLSDSGKIPVVLDSGELLKNPERVLHRLCNELGITFQKKMLAWEAGAISEDGVWAPYWYQTVHQSTGFLTQRTEDKPLQSHLIPLYEACMPYYEEMYKVSIQ